jgi:hypothetical protein
MKDFLMNFILIQSNKPNSTTSIERDKNNYQLIIEIFDRLLKFGIELVRDFIFYIYS